MSSCVKSFFFLFLLYYCCSEGTSWYLHTKVLVIYHHWISWIYCFHHFPLFLPPLVPGILSICPIFFIHDCIMFPLHSMLRFLKKKFLDRHFYGKFPLLFIDIFVILCMGIQNKATIITIKNISNNNNKTHPVCRLLIMTSIIRHTGIINIVT
jgi:hypothetical protein